MKINIFLFLPLLWVLTGCDSGKVPDPSQEITLYISANALSFEAASESKTFSVVSNGSWTISCSDGWLYFSTNSGNGNAEITATVAANGGQNGRTAVVTVVAGAATKTINVQQLGELPDILVDDKPLMLESSEGAFVLELTANVEYEILVSGEWLQQLQTKTMEKFTHTFSYKANISSKERQAVITIKERDSKTPITRTITVTQRGLIVVEKSLEEFLKTDLRGAVYNGDKFSFEFSEYSHQIAVNPARRAFRIQNYRQDTVCSVSLSAVATGLEQQITVTGQNLVLGVGEKVDFRTKVVKLTEDRVWLWAEDDKSGFIVTTKL